MNQHHQDLIVEALCQRFVKQQYADKEDLAKEATALIEAVTLVEATSTCSSLTQSE